MNSLKMISIIFISLIFLTGMAFVGYCVTEHETHAVHETHEAHEEHPHAEHHYGKSQLMDLLKRAVNFAIFVVIIYLVAAKPVGKSLRAREEEIKKTLDELERAKQAAHQKYLEYEAKLAQLDKEKEKIIQEFISLGESEKQKILETAEKMAQQIKEAAKRTAEHEAKAAKEHLRAEVAEMATKMAEEIIRKNFKPEDQKKLIEEYLSKIGG